MKKKQQNLPVKAKPNEMITVNQEKALHLILHRNFITLKIDQRLGNFYPTYSEEY